MTGFNRPVLRANDVHLFPADRERILALWCAGRDTLDIARVMGLPEAVIYNALPKLRDHARRDQEWNFERRPEVRAS